ncbi:MULTISPECIES: MFS transporter [unclassified Paenibacillus]|uniref:MFS transporter n=1 Tax=unclassified Paenibacillus TaxID=185978 RepID=UPI001AE15D3A|nr:MULTISPECIES: MFS transporter [unclassified Paenibacillus]MBP1157218.1 DHA1 family multidrug resistance protein-like MFS transporter [Paenibacillus sp. PvP091]MBP1172043.1 DHA1 family multidrug resistance protein-like MFS transporter [Paenibacillus sp. PvR098]MBP2438424.1 DHA1 family multidrug resistance protein-like MFS transporter [Paenibacillus sp. PvP052]
MKQNNNTALIMLMINMFIAMLGIGLIIPVLPDFLKAFDAAGQAAGYLIAAMGLTQFLFSPIAGEWSDKYGRKVMIVSGLALFSFSNFLFAVADEMWLLYVSRLIGGIGAAAMIPSMLAYIADITSEEDRGKGLGMLGASMSLGFVIGPGIGGFLAELGIRAPFYVSAAVGGFAMLLSWTLLRETRSMEERQSARLSTDKKENIWGQFAKSFKAPYLILLVLIFTLTFGLANFEAVFPLFVDQKYGYTSRDIAVLITVGALIGAVIQAVLIGKLIKRFGEKLLINLTFLLSAVSLVLMLLSGNFWYILVLTTLFFSFTSILRPAINTLLSKMAGDEQGFVAGMNNAYMSIGNIFGPALAGILFDVHVNIPYLFGAMVLIISLTMSLSWGRSKMSVAVK